MFLHKCPPNLGVWDGLWRFDFNCKLHSKHFCVVSEKRMRNESHKKKHRAAKERGEGEEERKNTPSPPPSPPSFFGSSSIFCTTEAENPIPRLSLVFLHSEVYHMEILATHSGYYNCYELTHCFRLRVFVNNGLPR